MLTLTVSGGMKKGNDLGIINKMSYEERD